MAAKSAWAGAITFAGFPIHVRAFTVVASRKSASFKMLDPVHKMPVSQKLVDIEGEFVERADTLKGVEVSKDGPGYVALGDDALELIENVERSVQVEIERFAPVVSLPLELSLESYRILPDEKVAGAEKPVNILWNALRGSERAAVIPNWCPRAGARPSTLAIRATGDGLSGNLIPFGSELKLDLPTWVAEHDEKAASLGAQMIEQSYTTDDFDISVYIDGHARRREDAIQMALSGQTIERPAAAPAPAAAPDLMAALEAQLAAGPAKKATKGKTPAKVKVAA